jgi:hypothetical protein
MPEVKGTQGPASLLVSIEFSFEGAIVRALSLSQLAEVLD